MSFHHFLMVGLGGFLGSIARYASARWIDERLNAVFPYGTLTVNIIGSFLLGLIVVWTSKRTESEAIRLFLGVGFCGGFTTFSAFALENYRLIDQKLTGISVLYCAVTLLAGFVAVAAGMFAGRNLN